MSKKVVIVSSSLRKNSNSEALAMAFADGAKAAGHEVEQISLRGKEIKFCQGCLACQKTMQCVLNDEANGIVEKMGQAGVCYTGLLLWHERSVKDTFGPGQSVVSGRLSFS